MGDPFDLAVALFIRANEVECDVANARRMEGTHAVGDLLWGAERRIALGRLAEVHGVAVAQCHRGGIEGLLVSIVEPCEKGCPVPNFNPVRPANLAEAAILSRPDLYISGVTT